MKKLLSFLGTGDYKECQYALSTGERAAPGRFVQTAVYELLCQDFTDEDEVVIFLTPTAREKNWLAKPQEEGLESAFRRIAPKARVRAVEISEEQGENSLWQLFDQVLNEIEEGTEIIFDITHSFRSFPVMAIVILNYTRLLKGAALRHIVYGAFELGRRLDNGEPDAPKVAPIVELTPLVKLMDWTIGIDHFLRSGDASLLQELTDSQKREISRRIRLSGKTARHGDAQRELEAAEKYRILAQQLDLFTKSLQTCRGPLLQDTADGLREKLQAAATMDTPALRPLSHLLGEVERRVASFTGNPAMAGYEAAQWCLDHGLIQQGFTFLQEGLFTAVCRVLGKNEMDRSVREQISSAFAIVEQNIPESKWRGSKSELKEIVAFLQPYRERIHWYSTLQSYRNSINHAGYNQPTPPQRFEKTLRKLLESSRFFFEELARLAEQTQENRQSVEEDLSNKSQDGAKFALRQDLKCLGPKMFLLLSHTLTEEQMKEARERFGVTGFFPLPESLQPIWSGIPAQGNWQQTWLEPIQYWLRKEGNSGDIVVVQGEFGATVYMVGWLRKNGFRPMYATSEREVVETPMADGSVVTQRAFRHVQFRDYPEE